MPIVSRRHRSLGVSPLASTGTPPIQARRGQMQVLDACLSMGYDSSKNRVTTAVVLEQQLSQPKGTRTHSSGIRN